MTRATRRWAAGLAAAVAASLELTSGWVVTNASATPAGPSPSATGQQAAPPTAPVCARPSDPRHAQCLAVRRTDVTRSAGVQPHATPAGYGPADLQAAYALPSATAGAGQTVAIVDAFDDPNAEADLAVYRQQFGLPPCTTANGCFRKVDQRGGTDYPPADPGWATEISLDLDMVSAVCPNCSILLVETDDNDLANLAVGVDRAVALGARYVSNSYGALVDDPALAQFDPHYTHPGVAVTASSGDDGFGISYPASSPGVTAVGGTSLRRDTSARGWSETVWSGAGSGCSQFENKPSWQVDSGCAHRAVADVSAVADPATGVAVYDTFQSGGWQVFGGTSVAAPIIAAVYALAGTPAAGTNPASYPYDAALVGADGLHDVTAGSNGACDPAYLCTAAEGYDGPTGLGTPDGVAAFVARTHGVLAGTVTDAATGRPVAGVEVRAGTRTARTDADGRYALDLPAGSYQLAVAAHGYQSQTLDVTVTADATTTRDVALTPMPRVTVTGTVTDASGQGWPLYAKVTASDGVVTSTVFTDPATGRYRLDLLTNTDYTLRVTAVQPGYLAADRQVRVGTTDLTEDVGLTVDASCTAPGYRAELTGRTETFDQATTPKGWRVSTIDHHQPGYANQPGWVFTNPGKRANNTGGTGNFAIVDSDHYGPLHIQDTLLTSPQVDLSKASTPAVQFATDLQAAVNSTATVELSTDGGRSWTTVWRKAGYDGVPGPSLQVVDLPQAAGKSRAAVRFHYVGSWSQWWAIDNVFLGNRVCTTVSGGLVVGQVTDASTGDGITGATVASQTDPDQRATTVSTPDDPDRGDGLYWLFSAATGEQRFTASAPGYHPATASAVVTAGRITRLDLALTPTS